MLQDPQLSGVHLARVALRAVREAARQNGGRTVKPKPRAGKPVRRDGRDPMGLGMCWVRWSPNGPGRLPAIGATLRERWAAIAPELAGHVAAVAFDADSGQLTVARSRRAWATKTRLEQARVIEAANASAGRTVVRALRILPPDMMPATEPADPPRLRRPGRPRLRVQRRPGRPRRPATAARSPLTRPPSPTGRRIRRSRPPTNGRPVP